MTQDEVFQMALGIATSVCPGYEEDPNTIALMATGIAKKESGYSESAKNKHSTARGLMQMLICTQREVEKKRAKVDFADAMYSCNVYPTDTVDQSDDLIFDPNYALLLAIHEICYQMNRYGDDQQKAIHAYNQGSFPGVHKSDGTLYARSVINNIYNIKLSSNTDMAAATGAPRKEFY